MQGRKTIKILATVTILVIICVAITYVKSDNKVVLATTKEFNSKNLQENEHMHIEIDSTGDKVPVPNGYVGSKATGENEIDTGYVIYEGEEEVNDSNVEEAQKTRNQYVWIPVPDVSKMYGIDANGKKWGKLYEFTTDTGENIDWVTGAKPLNWSESNGIMKITDKTNYREPDISVNSDIKSKMKSLNQEEKTSHDFLNQLESNFNSMVDSLEKYGGFYIGRYETGNLSKNTFVVRRGNTDISDQTWYTMLNKCKTLRGNNSNIETGLIWESQWDMVLMWLIESGNKTKEEIIVDSTSWGNHLNSTFEYRNSNSKLEIKKVNVSTKIPTGSTEYTKANNIYDLSGNVREWTVSSFQNYKKTSKAGSFQYNGINNSGLSYSNEPLYKHINLRLPCNAIYKISNKELNTNE